MTTGKAQGSVTRLGTGIISMLFSPDGATFAVATSDGAVTFVDIATGETRASLSGHTSTVESLPFSPDGRHLVTAGDDDGSVRVWNIALPTAEEAVDQICRAVKRDLTRDERAEYLPEPSAEPACPRHTAPPPDRPELGWS
jgi:WD40 repeat protein